MNFYKLTKINNNIVPYCHLCPAFKIKQKIFNKIKKLFIKLNNKFHKMIIIKQNHKKNLFFYQIEVVPCQVTGYKKLKIV